VPLGGPKVIIIIYYKIYQPFEVCGLKFTRFDPVMVDSLQMSRIFGYRSVVLFRKYLRLSRADVKSIAKFYVFDVLELGNLRERRKRHGTQILDRNFSIAPTTEQIVWYTLVEYLPTCLRD